MRKREAPTKRMMALGPTDSKNCIIPNLIIFKLYYIAALCQSPNFFLFSLIQEFWSQLSVIESWVYLNPFHHLSVSKRPPLFGKAPILLNYMNTIFYFTTSLLADWAPLTHSTTSVRPTNFGIKLSHPLVQCSCLFIWPLQGLGNQFLECIRSLHSLGQRSHFTLQQVNFLH